LEARARGGRHHCRGRGAGRDVRHAQTSHRRTQHGPCRRAHVEAPQHHPTRWNKVARGRIFLRPGGVPHGDWSPSGFYFCFAGRSRTGKSNLLNVVYIKLEQRSKKHTRFKFKFKKPLSGLSPSHGRGGESGCPWPWPRGPCQCSSLSLMPGPGRGGTRRNGTGPGTGNQSRRPRPP
jgi:hypothetical protein